MIIAHNASNEAYVYIDPFLKDSKHLRITVKTPD